MRAAALEMNEAETASRRLQARLKSRLDRISYRSASGCLRSTFVMSINHK
jgi:hypothetical protein